jgi:hypothetical protein
MANLISRSMGDLRRWQRQNVKKEKGGDEEEREREREKKEILH